MKYVLTFLTFLFLSSALPAEDLVKAVSFAEEPLSVSAVPGEQFQLLIELDEPGISSSVYALKGMIRYAGVQGDGFLQMDNHFGERGTFFTKSLAPSGPLGRISGSSDWRPFTLPFNASGGDPAGGAAPLPEKLSLALYLPGPGTVSIRDVALYQYAAGEDPLGSTRQWFSNRDAGLLGGIGGALLGLWGALIGIVASRGLARGFVLASANAMLVLGIVCLVGGVSALATSQPYAVYYTLLLIGIMLVVVMGKLRGTLSARYEQLELKKIQSMDA